MVKRVSRRLRKLAARRAMTFMVSVCEAGAVELTLYAGRRTLSRELDARDVGALIELLKSPISTCAWRIEHADFACHGFTTDFDEALRWVGLGAVVIPLHVARSVADRAVAERATGKVSLVELLRRVQAGQIPAGIAKPRCAPRRKPRGR